jgi:hypothetical protein
VFSSPDMVVSVVPVEQEYVNVRVRGSCGVPSPPSIDAEQPHGILPVRLF